MERERALEQSQGMIWRELMSENITHIAVCDDCLRLMPQIPDICDAFKQVARDHLDIAQLGSVTRSTDRFNPELLKRLRGDWAGSSTGWRPRATATTKGSARDF